MEKGQMKNMFLIVLLVASVVGISGCTKYTESGSVINIGNNNSLIMIPGFIGDKEEKTSRGNYIYLNSTKNETLLIVEYVDEYSYTTDNYFFNESASDYESSTIQIGDVPIQMHDTEKSINNTYIRSYLFQKDGKYYKISIGFKNQSMKNNEIATIIINKL